MMFGDVEFQPPENGPTVERQQRNHRENRDFKIIGDKIYPSRIFAYRMFIISQRIVKMETKYIYRQGKQTQIKHIVIPDPFSGNVIQRRFSRTNNRFL